MLWWKKIRLTFRNSASDGIVLVSGRYSINKLIIMTTSICIRHLRGIYGRIVIPQTGFYVFQNDACNTTSRNSCRYSSSLSAPPACLLRPMEFPTKTLMGPGPSNCPERVLKAQSLPLLGHLHPEFTQVFYTIRN